jgi:hypothetical protein
VLVWAENQAFISAIGLKLARMAKMILLNQQNKQVWQFA